MKNKNLIIALVALCLAVVALLGIALGTRQRPTAGSKEFTVTVVHRDGTEKVFSYTSDAEYLGNVLVEKGLIAGQTAQYGLMIQTVDGEDAVYETDQAYWAFYIGEEYATTGVDTTPIQDGVDYRLVYTVG